MAQASLAADGATQAEAFRRIGIATYIRNRLRLAPMADQKFSVYYRGVGDEPTDMAWERKLKTLSHSFPFCPDRKPA
jgi:hypothetical protein